MKILAINGSMRKNGNCVALLREAEKGAAEKGAEIEEISLCDLTFKGCTSCFACRRKPSPAVGCGYEDSLQPVLKSFYSASAIIIAAPIYFASLPAQMHAFIERLLYHYPHNEGNQTYKPVRFIYSMNATREQAENLNYHLIMSSHEDFFKRNFIDVNSIYAYNTWQYDNYDNYVHSYNLESKVYSKEFEFPKYINEAYTLGAELIDALEVCK